MRKVLKWVAYTVGGLVVLLLVAGAALYVIGGSKMGQTHEVQATALPIPTDSASVARGEHLVLTNGCRLCHGPQLAGQVMIDAPPFRVVASNLTRGRNGIGSTYTDADWERVIRHGIKPDGRPVVIMPAAGYHHLADEDAAALIAYLKTIPPVDNDTLGATQFRAMGRILVGAGQFDPAFEVRTGRSPASRPPAGPTAEYGRYLASVPCAYCHGENLKGAQPPEPGAPFAPALSAASAWPLDAFRTFLRTGTRPDGSRVNAQFMPIEMTRHYTDEEVAALHAYLNSVNWSASTDS